MSFDEAAAQVPRDGLSKNEWKRRVKNLIFMSKKDARKRERAGDDGAEAKGESGAEVMVASAGDHAVEAAPPKKLKKTKTEAAPKEERDIRIVIDCSFDHLMTDKELHSLSFQIRDCYGANKALSRPCHLVVASKAGSRLRARLESDHVVASWKNFELFDGAFEVAQFPDVRYLSSEGAEVLDKVPEGCTVVIGGLVDRNRHKGITAALAAEKNIPCYRLPPEAVPGKKPLTTNQVAELVLRYLTLGSWAEAGQRVVPKRLTPKE